MIITRPECMFVALRVQHATTYAVLPSVACPSIQYFPTLSHKRHDFRAKNTMELKTCVLIFTKTSVWKISHSTKTCERYDHICTEDLHVKFPLLLSEFNKSWTFSTDFLKINSDIKFHENLSNGSRVAPWGRMDRRTEGRTDRHDESNSRHSQLCKRD